MKKEFTFCLVTYNQQRYIIDALESIKYQIVTYGNGIDTYLVLADDASQDMTLPYLDSWLQQNKSLFFDIQVIRHTKNQGTVFNVMSALQAVRTEAFKLLAGDDVFSAGNCFELIDLLNDFDFVSYLNIEFEDNELCNSLSLLPNYVFYHGTSCRFIREHLIYEYVLSAPGTAFRHSLLTPDFYEFMSRFKYLDDHAMWAYLFNNVKIKTAWRDKVIILHRIEQNSLQHNSTLITAVQKDRMRLNEYQRTVTPNIFARIMLDLNDKALNGKSPIAQNLFNLLRRVGKAPHMLWSRLTKMKPIVSAYIVARTENKAYLPNIMRSAESFLTDVQKDCGEDL